jgi:hypothetical protein
MKKIKRIMSEHEMQEYVNEKLGYNVEFLLEYAIRELGYEAKIILNEQGNEEYLFSSR